MSRIGIIGAMEKELELLKRKLTKHQILSLQGQDLDTGLLEGHEIGLLQSGIGKVNAAIGATMMIEHFKPDLLLNTGSAGGLNTEHRIGDVILGDAILHHDADVTGFNYEYGQIPGNPPVFSPDPALLEAAEKAIALLPGKRFFRGTIGSGDQFICKEEQLAILRKRFPSLECVEMESAAIAQTAAFFDIPFLVIRALSDIAGEESPVSFDQFLETASVESAETVLAILAQIPKEK